MMEPRCPRRRLRRPSPWRRPGATLDAGRWCGPTCSDLFSTDQRSPTNRFPLARRRRTHREYWTRIADEFVGSRCGPGPNATGLRVTERV